MTRKILFNIVICVFLVALTACINPTTTPTPNANMANPASVFCEQNGGKLDIRTDAAGNQTGICVFPNASECDEWAYFRGECKPTAESTAPVIGGGTGMANPASVYCEDHGGKLDIRTDAAGNQGGICTFPNGSQCEEWAYFRGECKPAEDAAAPKLGGGTGMANPASVYCEDHGGKLDIRTDAAGNQSGICTFPDGSQCDEWAYFRGECNAATAPTLAPAAETAIDGWKVYKNTTFGFSFHYPADAVLQTEDEAKSISVVGPLKDNNWWPMIFFNHPADREDYRPAEGTDLKQWLIDHNLLFVAELKDDVQIAGTTAYHTRMERSEQSYAMDRYYFAKNGQLYSLVIVHTGKEDWTLYNHFLESIQFD